jgi:STE24 endopeptidase
MEEQNKITLEKDSAEAKVYSRLKVGLSILDMAVNFLLLIIFAFTGVSRSLVNYIDFYFYDPYIQFILFSLVAGGVFFAVDLMFGWYGGYFIEHEFALSKQTLTAWLRETLKSSALSLLIAFPLLLVFFFLIRTLEGNWWWVFALVMILFSVLIARIAPTLIFPLFYRFVPLTEGEVHERITALLQKENISFSGIYTFNMSKNTRKANAGFAGIGRSRRIILSDTLLNEFSSREIEVIFAHELGHYRGRHILKNVIFGSLVIMLSFALCGSVYSATITRMGFLHLHDIAALPILLFYLSVFSLLIMPVTNFISRGFEREADAYAIESTQDAEAFISSMRTLSSINLSDSDPHPLVEFLFHGHPSIRKRIDFARKKLN